MATKWDKIWTYCISKSTNNVFQDFYEEIDLQYFIAMSPKQG